MRSVYIAGPLSAPTPEEQKKNVERAARVATKLYEQGYAVFCPHLQTAWIDENLKPRVKYEDWLVNDIYWLCKCDVVIFLPEWGNSRGAQIEHLIARGLGKETVYLDEREFRAMTGVETCATSNV